VRRSFRLLAGSAARLLVSMPRSCAPPARCRRRTGAAAPRPTQRRAASRTGGLRQLLCREAEVPSALLLVVPSRRAPTDARALALEGELASCARFPAQMRYPGSDREGPWELKAAPRLADGAVLIGPHLRQPGRRDEGLSPRDRDSPVQGASSADGGQTWGPAQSGAVARDRPARAAGRSRGGYQEGLCASMSRRYRSGLLTRCRTRRAGGSIAAIPRPRPGPSARGRGTRSTASGTRLRDRSSSTSGRRPRPRG
jgi:hypothetical protein